MDLIPLSLQELTWADIGYAFQPTVFMCIGGSVLWKIFSNTLPRPLPVYKKIFAAVAAITFVLFPFYRAPSSPLLEGKVVVAILSRWHGMTYPEVRSWAFAVTIPVLVGIACLLDKIIPKKKAF